MAEVLVMPSPCPISSRPQYGPFMGVQLDKPIEFKKGKRKFRVIVYAAYNAFGLIGPESNGVAILDDDNKKVVCDEIAKETSGYFGASQRQLATAESICKLSWKEFQSFVNANPRLRFSI